MTRVEKDLQLRLLLVLHRHSMKRHKRPETELRDDQTMLTRLSRAMMTQEFHAAASLQGATSEQLALRGAMT